MVQKEYHERKKGIGYGLKKRFSTEEVLELMEAWSDHIAENAEPYFGWCNVKGCDDEACNGGSCWRETGYWNVCHKHSDMYRKGKPQPKMKQWAVDKEKSRDKKKWTIDLKKQKV